MNKPLTQAAIFAAASIAFVAAAMSTEPQAHVRPAPTESAQTAETVMPVCVKVSASHFTCKTAI